MAEIKTIFTADSTRLTAEIEKNKKGVRSLVDTVMGLGSKFGLGLTAMGFAAVGLSRKIVASAGEIADASDALGISPRTLQTFQALGREAGITAEKMESTLGRVLGAREDALADSTSKAAQNFERMGITIEALRSMSPEETLEAVGKAAKESASDVQVMSAVMDVVGAKSRRMITALRQLGTEGFAGAEARTTSTIVSEDAIKSLDQLGDQISWQSKSYLAYATSDLQAVLQAIKLAPKTFEAENDRLKKLGEEAQRARAALPGQEGLNPRQTTAMPSEMAQKLLADNMRQSLSFGGMSDALLRIGGGTGRDVQNQQLNVLNSINTGITQLVNKDTSPKMR